MIDDRLDVLVHAKVAATKKRPKLEQIAKAIKPFAPTTTSDGDLRERITASLDRIANAELEARPWKQLVEKDLPGEILGVDRVTFKSRDAWAAAIVGRVLGLWSEGTPPKLTALCDALVWRELGLTTKPRTCPEEIRALFIQKQLDGADGGKSDRHVRVLAASTVRAIRPETKLLRDALVRMWLVGESLGATRGSFVQDLRRVVDGARDGVFGDRKVFVSAAWRELASLPSWSSLTLADFKSRVLEAHRAGAVELARADLVGAMDPDLVAASETIGDGARFHFLVKEMS